MSMPTFEMLTQHSIESICTELGKWQPVSQIRHGPHLS